MMREGIQKRRASISKTTGVKSNVYTRLGEQIEGAKQADTIAYTDVLKVTSIDGQRCGVNGGQG